MNHEAAEEEDHQGRSWAELMTLIVSILIVISVVGLMTWLYLEDSNVPPRLHAEPAMDQLRHEGDSFTLPVVVSNDGDRSAEDVAVVAELIHDDGTETAEFTLGFLAGKDKATGFVRFMNDPREGDLSVSVTSFREP